MNQTVSAIVLSSGGPRSLATLLAALRQHGAAHVQVLHVDYGQRLEAAERAAVSNQCTVLGAQFVVVAGRLNSLALSSRMTWVGDLPAEHPQLRVRMERGGAKGALGKWLHGPQGPRVPSPHFLPGLAMHLCALASMLAIREEAAEVWTGLSWPSSGIEALQEAARWSTQAPDLVLQAPLSGQPLHKALEACHKEGRLEMARAAVGCHAGASSLWRPWGAGCGECQGCRMREEAWGVFAKAHLPPEPEPAPVDQAQVAEDERRAELGRQRIEDGGVW